MSHVYAALLEPEPEGGFTVTFPEIGVGATYGETWDEALRQAEDMLEEAVLGLIAHGEEVPEPAPQSDAVREDSTAERRSRSRLSPPPSSNFTARCVKPGSTRRSWLSGWAGPRKDRPYLRRLPRRPPRQLETALAALGRRFVVTSNQRDRAETG